MEKVGGSWELVKINPLIVETSHKNTAIHIYQVETLDFGGREVKARRGGVWVNNDTIGIESDVGNRKIAAQLRREVQRQQLGGIGYAQTVEFLAGKEIMQAVDGRDSFRLAPQAIGEGYALMLP